MQRRVVALTLLAIAGLVAPPAVAQNKGGGKTTPPAQKPPEKKDDKKKEYKTPFKVGSETDPAISIADISGKSQSLKDLRGKIVVLHFWSLDPMSAAYDKALAALYADYSKKGVVFIAIDPNKADVDAGADKYKKIQDYAAKAGLTFPIAVDSSYALVDKFGAQTTAHSFVIDAKGIVKYSGAVNDDPDGKKGDKATPELKNALDALVGGKDPAAATTTPGGAAIKKEAAKPAAAPPPAGGGGKAPAKSYH
jgi:peroxiredoxin